MRREGQRRSRGRRFGTAVLIALAVALPPLAVAVAGYFALAPTGDRHADASVSTRPPPPPARALRPRRILPTVRLSGVDAFHMQLRRPPRAGLLFDVRTGEVLWRLHPLEPLPIASLTKIMTALLVTRYAGPEERVRITKSALHYEGSGVGVLPLGKRVRLETLLNGLLIVSGNDAAIALADHVAHTERRFVRLMNREARRMGLRCTRFVSSHGLERRNLSCARDVAVLTRLAMRQHRIARIVRRRQVAFRFPIKGRRLFLSTHNPLLRVGYRGAIGLKTGYTGAAGRCFVGVARRHGRTLGVVLLGSPNPYRHAPRLLNAGFRFG